jgi:hypothetical protein
VNFGHERQAMGATLHLLRSRTHKRTPKIMKIIYNNQNENKDNNDTHNDNDSGSDNDNEKT